MNTLLHALLIAHITTGFTTLLVGLIPMFSRKGSPLHNRAGLIFVYCMIFVAASALLLCVLQPFKMMRLFLTGIAVFSFYLSMTGWRTTKQKSGQATGFDRGLTYATLAVSVGMIGFGFYLLVQNGLDFFSVLFSFFGALTFRFAFADYGQQPHRRTGRPAQKMHWYFQHFIRMGGAYIASFTAALVTNLGRVLPLNAPEWLGTLAWIAPSIIGGLIIARTVRHYGAKFKLTR